MEKMEQLVKPDNEKPVTEYRRSLNHNYLILKNPVSEETGGFSFQMIMENKISSLLDMDVKNENGEQELCYEISSLQSLSRVYEIRKITGEELAEMIRSIVEVFHRIKEYMLTEEEVVMLPEYIFMNPETRQMRFMYCPYMKQNCRNLFWELAEFFLEHVEHQDSEAVILAYQFYKIVRSENYVLQEIQQLCEKQFENFLQEKKEKKEKIQIQGHNGKNDTDYAFRDAESNYENADDNGYFKDAAYPEPPDLDFKKERKFSGKIPGKTTDTRSKNTQFIIFLIITLISLVLIFKNSNPINSYSKIISIGFFLFGLGGAVVCLLKMKLQKKEPNAESERMTGKEAEGMTDKLAGNYNFEDTFGQMQSESYEEQEDDMKSGETIYGKTEFCLITPEEEERVLIEKRHGKEIRHRIDTLPYTIGKLKDMSDLYLPDNTVSRLHARIFEEEGKLYVLDLGSTNGTYLNGISINQEEKFLLEAGDELRIGKTEFIYQ